MEQHAVTEGWYGQLKEELDALLTEMHFNVRWALIEWNHKIGETIRQHTPEGQLDMTLGNLAADCKKSKRTLYNAVRLFDAYPLISEIPDGKNASMNKLMKQLGSGTKSEDCLHEDYKTIRICNKCGKQC